MTTKRKRVILNEVKNLYIPSAQDIVIEKNVFHTHRGAACCARISLLIQFSIYLLSQLCNTQSHPEYAHDEEHEGDARAATRTK